MQRRLEVIGATFLDGYHRALRLMPAEELAAELDMVELERRGFAFEGAAMGLALLDALTPWKGRRVSRFICGEGERHIYMVHVGVGWLWARLPRFLRPYWRSVCRLEHGDTVPDISKQLDPLLAWLVYDGWGFHEGFFHWSKYVAGQPAPKDVKGYARRVFDQGLGRSFWFVNGGNPKLIKETINGLAPERRADLWSGVGLAAAYAGIVSEAMLSELKALAGSCEADLAQGAVFALKARERAGNLTEYNELAAQELCGLSAREAATLADETLEEIGGASIVKEPILRSNDSGQHENLERSNSQTLTTRKRSTSRPHRENSQTPLYEIWRKRIQDYFAGVQMEDASELANQPDDTTFRAPDVTYLLPAK